MGAALISVVTNTANLLLDKNLLTNQRMKIANYIPLLFVFLFAVTAVTLPWTGAVEPFLAGEQQYIFYFILMVLLAIMWNIFYYQGLQQEKMIEFEMIMMLTPLATILLATLFFPEEFNPAVFSAALIGGAALFLSHLRRHHFAFDRYAIHLLLAVLLMAMESIVQNELLRIYSPALLYATRTGILALFFTIYYRPDMAEVKRHQFRLVFWSAVMGAASMVAKFYGYQEIGITFTTLVLLLVPILASWLDARINKSGIKHRTVIAFVVILLCVVYAIMNQ